MKTRMELGSEFHLSLSQLETTEYNLIHYLADFPYLSYFDSGRSAIRYFASQLEAGSEILLPEFICESVIKCFNLNKVIFYHILDDYSIDIVDLCSKITLDTKVIFIMHYFGSLQSETTLIQLKGIARDYNLIILEDMTHGIFSAQSTIGDYVVASIRKWIPIPQGGVLYAPHDKLALKRPVVSKSRSNNRVEGMVLKDLFLQGRLECKPAYRKIFAEADNSLECQKDIYGISELAFFLLSCYDISDMIRRRQKNYKYLYERLKQYGLSPDLNLREQECPFVYPIKVPKRDHLRRYLIENRIYCAVHWPFDGIHSSDRPMAKKKSEMLLSLPIDQRYDREHMDYLIKVLTNYGGGLQY